MYCARCGSRLWVKSSSELGTLSYICGRRWHGPCTALQFPVSQVEEKVTKLLQLLVVPDGAYQSAIERVEVDNGEVIKVVGKDKYRDLVAALGAALHA
jgi:hypothetical protein